MNINTKFDVMEINLNFLPDKNGVIGIDSGYSLQFDSDEFQIHSYKTEYGRKRIIKLIEKKFNPINLFIVRRGK
jgi:hypothetical protein